MDKTPAALGYRMPAEWEPHVATWIAWPHNRDDWPGKFSPVGWVYTEIVRHLSRTEQVRIVIRNGAMQKSRRRPVRCCRRQPRHRSILQGGDRSEPGYATQARRSSSTNDPALDFPRRGRSA